jgi:hypothetical protein
MGFEMERGFEKGIMIENRQTATAGSSPAMLPRTVAGIRQQ